MKIVHVITAFGVGGAEKLLLNVMNKQVTEHDVYLVYLKPIDDLIHLVDKRVNKKFIPFSFSAIKKMKQHFEMIKPNIIHTHLGHADLLGIWVARNTSAKIFCTMHNIYFKKNMIDNVFFAAYKFLFSKYDVKVISISKSVEEHVINRLKLSRKKSYLLFNAIPSKENIEDKKISVSRDKVNLLFVGRLVKQKSVDTLIQSLSILKDRNILLTIVGDGELNDELIQMSKKIGVDHLIKFVGIQQDVESFYSKADIFVLPSIWEGFGIVILEAFSAKLAVIASNIEGPAELIKNNENGLLFEPTNHKELADKIIILLDDVELRSKLANNAYKTFTNEFHINDYVKKLNQIYTDA